MKIRHYGKVTWSPYCPRPGAKAIRRHLHSGYRVGFNRNRCVTLAPRHRGADHGDRRRSRRRTRLSHDRRRCLRLERRVRRVGWLTGPCRWRALCGMFSPSVPNLHLSQLHQDKFLHFQRVTWRLPGSPSAPPEMPAKKRFLQFGLRPVGRYRIATGEAEPRDPVSNLPAMSLRHCQSIFQGAPSGSALDALEGENHERARARCSPPRQGWRNQ